MAQQKERNKAGAYVCPDCDRTFGSPQNLGRHRQAMHPISTNDDQAQDNLSEGDELNDNPMLAALRDRLSSVTAELITVTEQREQLERESAWLNRIQSMVEAGPEAPPA